MALSAVGPERVRGGDGDRFDGLFRTLQPRLLTLTHRLLGDRGEAEDVVQEAFMRLAGTAVAGRPDAEIAAWLRRVCLNLGANRLRDRRRAERRLEHVGRLEAVETVDGPAHAVLEQEERERVRVALGRLPDRQRDCLLLRHSGYTYAEIAATLGIAVGSVGVILARAERAFRDIYRELDHDESDDHLP